MPPHYCRADDARRDAVVSSFNEGLHWELQARIALHATSDAALARLAVADARSRPVPHSDLTALIDDAHAEYFEYHDVPPRLRARLRLPDRDEYLSESRRTHHMDALRYRQISVFAVAELPDFYFVRFLTSDDRRFLCGGVRKDTTVSIHVARDEAIFRPVLMWPGHLHSERHGQHRSLTQDLIA